MESRFGHCLGSPVGCMHQTHAPVSYAAWKIRYPYTVGEALVPSESATRYSHRALCALLVRANWATLIKMDSAGHENQLVRERQLWFPRQGPANGQCWACLVNSASSASKTAFPLALQISKADRLPPTLLGLCPLFVRPPSRSTRSFAARFFFFLILATHSLLEACYLVPRALAASTLAKQGLAIVDKIFEERRTRTPQLGLTLSAIGFLLLISSPGGLLRRLLPVKKRLVSLVCTFLHTTRLVRYPVDPTPPPPPTVFRANFSCERRRLSPCQPFLLPSNSPRFPSSGPLATRSRSQPWKARRTSTLSSPTR